MCFRYFCIAQQPVLEDADSLTAFKLLVRPRVTGGMLCVAESCQERSKHNVKFASASLNGGGQKHMMGKQAGTERAEYCTENNRGAEDETELNRFLPVHTAAPLAKTVNSPDKTLSPDVRRSHV